MKNDQLYPETTKEIYEKRVALAPEMSEAFHNFGKVVFKEGALSEKTKQLIAVAGHRVVGHNLPISSKTLIRLTVL